MDGPTTKVVDDAAAVPTTDLELMPDHVAVNQDYWDSMADSWVSAGEECWAASSPYWGIWHHPERDLKLLPETMIGMRAIELGCGAAYASGWMIRRGADQVVGIDNSAQQLQTAKRLATQHGLASKLTLVHGNAETIDAEDGAFDFALSEYGAVTWCDPYVWVKEAHRVLKPGGNLVILGNHPLLQVCLSPDGELAEEQLHRPYFGLHKLDWSGVAADPGGVEFGLPFGKWVALFIETGFEIEGFIEPKIPNDASGIQFCATAEWSRDYPPECVWKLRKRD